MQPIEFEPPNPCEQNLFYTDGADAVPNGCIGHLRADFGSEGREFFCTWQDHHHELKTQDFKDELQQLIHSLRTNIENPLLRSRYDMASFCYISTKTRVVAETRRSYGVKINTEKYSYYLRCTPIKGEYDLYCYCFKRAPLEMYLAEKTKAPESQSQTLPKGKTDTDINHLQRKENNLHRRDKQQAR